MANDVSDRTQFVYLIFGLVVSSQVECPELQPGTGHPDIVFRFGTVPETLPGAVNESIVGEVLPGLFLLRIRETASFLIRDGKEVTIHPHFDFTPDALKLFLLGPVLGILLHQRGFLPLHASAVVDAHGPAIVLAGATGAGKSTVAAAFARRGYSVIADEICAIDTRMDPVVVPAPSYLSLWSDALDRLGVNSSQLRKVRADINKFVLPSPRGPVAARIPLHTCYILERSNIPGEITLEPLEGLQKVGSLAGQTYRRTMVEALDLTAGNFEQVCRVSASTRVVVVRRAWGVSMADQVVDALEQDFAA